MAIIAMMARILLLRLPRLRRVNHPGENVIIPARLPQLPGYHGYHDYHDYPGSEGAVMADLSHVDLLELIGADVRLRRKSAASGEWMGACPVCGGRDRFTVWPSPSKGKPRYWCRQCGAKGDAADYLVWRGRAATMGEALKMLGSEYTGAARSEPRPIEPPATAEPPPVAWQERARSFADYAGRVLWSRDGVEGLEMLRRRGLKDDTIRAAGLGYNPKELHDDPRRWGLEADHKPV